jgi:hypothetical protein
LHRRYEKRVTSTGHVISNDIFWPSHHQNCIVDQKCRRLANRQFSLRI